MKSAKKASKRVNNYEVYPKAGVAQTIMYQNMSSHYRRIYNAKPRVDTGPPFSHKPVKPCVPSKRIGWNKKQNEAILPKKSQSAVSFSFFKCSREGCGDDSVPSFHPQISKTDVESKLRSLRVYHPPRRRVYSTSATSIQIKREPEPEDVSVPDIPWIHTTKEAKTTPSKGSSSDSAYTEEGEGGWSGGESRGPTPISDTQRTSSENLLYVKFVRGITEEVLRKGIYTNKALKKIFQTHIESHKEFLNLRRMQEEVEKLQVELGIPKEDELDDLNYSMSFTSSESSDKCTRPPIQDMELLDALSQLNLSPSLKADIANSLGLYSTSNSYSSIESNDNLKLPRNSQIPKRTTFSSPLEIIHDISHAKKEKFNNQQKFPQSDDDSYEMVSEGSESRPLSPLGLVW